MNNDWGAIILGVLVWFAATFAVAAAVAGVLSGKDSKYEFMLVNENTVIKGNTQSGLIQKCQIVRKKHETFEQYVNVIVCPISQSYTTLVQYEQEQKAIKTVQEISPDEIQSQ